MNSEIIIYQNPEGDIKIDVRLEEEFVWLTQAQLCELFQKSKATISEHIKNVFEDRISAPRRDYSSTTFATPLRR